VTLADMHRPFDLLERYGTEITGRDAVHAATMLNNGLTHIISADGHFDIIEGITRLGPQKAARLKA
jgi:predicted nucleic acid-binding protein